MITNHQEELRATCWQSSEKSTKLDSEEVAKLVEDTTRRSITIRLRDTLSDLNDHLDEQPEKNSKQQVSSACLSTPSCSFRNEELLPDTGKRETTGTVREKEEELISSLKTKQKLLHLRKWNLRRNSTIEAALIELDASPANKKAKELEKNSKNIRQFEKRRQTRKVYTSSQQMNPFKALHSKTVSHLLVFLVSYVVYLSTCPALSLNLNLNLNRQAAAKLSNNNNNNNNNNRLPHNPNVALLSEQHESSLGRLATFVHHPSSQFFDQQSDHQWLNQHEGQLESGNNEQLRRLAFVNAFVNQQDPSQDPGGLQSRAATVRTPSELEQQNWLNNLLQQVAADEQQKRPRLDAGRNQFSSSPEYAILSAQQVAAESENSFAREQPSSQHFSTAPTINRQLITPPQYYEIGLAPTNALQIELNRPASEQNSHSAEHDDTHQVRPIMLANQRSNAARSLSFGRVAAAAADHLLHGNSQTARSQLEASSPSSGSQQQSAAFDQQQQLQIAADANKANSDLSTGGGALSVDQSKLNTALEGEAKNSAASASSSSSSEAEQTEDNSKATFEPRQRRRIFNRILKKAEWNHLFVELSKVFLRYFLDLALKDIIGKQSGGDTTTSRKKLDAQSELTDLLKDFVKTAISNI